MRTGLWMAALLLALVCAGGVACERKIDAASTQYERVGQELQELCAAEDWSHAEDILNNAWQQWCKTMPWLCAIVNHADAELLTAALTEVKAGVRVQDRSRAVSGSYAVSAAAEALREHERLSIENIL